MALFESYDRRIDHINAVLNEYGINGIEDAKAICDAKGIDPYTMCKETQPICFENACWAYVVAGRWLSGESDLYPPCVPLSTD